MSEPKDYYRILEIPRSASAEEVRTAFRHQARLYHPDVAQGEFISGEHFKEVLEAYEVLGNRQKRSEYDSIARDAASAPGIRGRGVTSTYPSERQANRGKNIELEVLLSLNDVLSGTTRTVSYLRGANRTRESMQVKIFSGTKDGQQVRVSGKGEEGFRGGKPGDLLLRVRYAAHPLFQVQNSNLIYTLKIEPWVAVLGSVVSIPTLEDKVPLNIPSGVQHGQQLRLHGLGLPMKGQGRADMIIAVHIQVPTDVPDEERALWEQLKELSQNRHA